MKNIFFGSLDTSYKFYANYLSITFILYIYKIIYFARKLFFLFTNLFFFIFKNFIFKNTVVIENIFVLLFKCE